MDLGKKIISFRKILFNILECLELHYIFKMAESLIMVRKSLNIFNFLIFFYPILIKLTSNCIICQDVSPCNSL